MSSWVFLSRTVPDQLAAEGTINVCWGIVHGDNWQNISGPCWASSFTKEIVFFLLHRLSFSRPCRKISNFSLSRQLRSPIATTQQNHESSSFYRLVDILLPTSENRSRSFFYRSFFALLGLFITARELIIGWSDLPQACLFCRPWLLPRERKASVFECLRRCVAVKKCRGSVKTPYRSSALVTDLLRQPAEGWRSRSGQWRKHARNEHQMCSFVISCCTTRRGRFVSDLPAHFRNEMTLNSFWEKVQQGAALSHLLVIQSIWMNFKLFFRKQSTTRRQRLVWINVALFTWCERQSNLTQCWKLKNEQYQQYYGFLFDINQWV